MVSQEDKIPGERGVNRIERVLALHQPGDQPTRNNESESRQSPDRHRRVGPYPHFTGGQELKTRLRQCAAMLPDQRFLLTASVSSIARACAALASGA